MPEAWGIRKRLPDDRNGVLKNVEFGDSVSGTVCVGLYEDGTPGEIFIRIDRMGSSIQGLLNAWAVTFSIALQNGVPLESLVKSLSGMRFEPDGWSSEKDIGFAKSIVDYIMRWLGARFKVVV